MPAIPAILGPTSSALSWINFRASRSGHGLFTMPDVPKPISKPKPPTPPKVDEDTFYRVVTGSFSSRDNANQRMIAIKAQGFDSFLLAFDVDGKTMFRVITGSFTDRANANQRIDELKQAGFESFIAIYKR